MKTIIKEVVRKRIRGFKAEIKRPILDIIHKSEKFLNQTKTKVDDDLTHEELRMALLEFDRILAQYKQGQTGQYPFYSRMA